MRDKTVPAKSKSQQRFMGAELSRKRAGKETRTDMSEAELEKLATKPKGKRLPEKVKAKK
jgi:hypothetical protein